MNTTIGNQLPKRAQSSTFPEVRSMSSLENYRPLVGSGLLHVPNASLSDVVTTASLHEAALLRYQQELAAAAATTIYSPHNLPLSAVSSHGRLPLSLASTTTSLPLLTAHYRSQPMMNPGMTPSVAAFLQQLDQEQRILLQERELLLKRQQVELEQQQIALERTKLMGSGAPTINFLAAPTAHAMTGLQKSAAYKPTSVDDEKSKSCHLSSSVLSPLKRARYEEVASAAPAATLQDEEDDVEIATAYPAIFPSPNAKSPRRASTTPQDAPQQQASPSLPPLKKRKKTTRNETTAEIDKNEKRKPPASTGPVQVILEPTDHDVLSVPSRGRVYEPPGNRSFRLSVEKFHDFYLKAVTKPEKAAVVQFIVQEVHKRGGRFLKRYDCANNLEEGVMWVELTEDETNRKTRENLIRYCNIHRKKEEAVAAQRVDASSLSSGCTT